MLRLSHRLWRRDLNEMASGKPGAVQREFGQQLGLGVADLPEQLKAGSVEAGTGANSRSAGGAAEGSPPPQAPDVPL
jgi:hypothetical protein